MFVKILLLLLFIAAGLLGTGVALLYLQNSITIPITKETTQQKTTSPLQTLLQTVTTTSQPSPEPLAEFTQPGISVVLPGAKWVPQSFNNCAPATTSMILQYFGHSVSQVETKAALRTTDSDKNVFTPEIQMYLKTKYNIESKLGFGGDLTLLKTLFANGFYVMVEDWLHPNEDIGHNAIIRGYDDQKGVVIADDSFIGVGVTFPYDSFYNNQWKAFNREYLVVYTKQQEPLLRAILGKRWDDTGMWQHAVSVSLTETQTNPQDMYAWFNLGSSYFGQGEYQKAALAFQRAQNLGWPKRMLWYQIQPIQTYIELGEYQKALNLIAEGLTGNQDFAELHYEAARAYRGLGNSSKAKEEIRTALLYAPNYEPAQILWREL